MVESKQSDFMNKQDIVLTNQSSQADIDQGEILSYGGTKIIDARYPKKKWYHLNLPKNKKDWRAWVTWLEATPSRGLTLSQQFLYSEDLKPVETARRKWRWWNFVSLWIADAINVKSWQIAGTGVKAGLTWWETWLAIWVGYAVSGYLIVITARVGSYAHISFPVSCRASFGIYGSLWPVINRVCLSVIWFSSQTWILGQLVQLMLFAVFGPHVNEKIGLGELSGTTVFGFVAFFIGWVCQLPAIWMKPHTVRHFYNVKAVVAPIVSIAFLVWALVRAHGAGDTISNPQNELFGSDRAWAWINMFMSCISNYAALVMNSPDFTRFALKPSDATWSQGLTIPISFSINSLIGLLITSTSQSMYGTVMWNPLDVLQKFVDGNTAGERAGVFLISLGLCIAQIGTNLVANSISAGTDMTALLPRFINIRRGGYICAMLALCVCPWHFFSSGSNFTTYLSAYSIFLSCIVGVIVADYYWLRRGKVELYELYTNDKNSPYMYNTKWGCNWRGYLAYFLGLIPNMPGFAGKCGRDVPDGAIKLYYFNYIVGFFVSFILYILFNWRWPPQNVPEELKGRLFDPKAPWLEENLDVDNFAEEYRYGSGLGVIVNEQRPDSDTVSYRSRKTFKEDTESV